MWSSSGEIYKYIIFYVGESPRGSNRKPSENKSGVCESNKKNNLPKLPPKPIINPNVPNYRLPPKPSQNNSRVNGSNKSIEINRSR